MLRPSIKLTRTIGLLGGVSLAALLGPLPAVAQTAAADSEVSEVVITGSRLAVTGFTAPTPVTTMSAEQMQVRGTPTAIDAMNELPQFRNTTGQQRGTGGTFAGGQGLLDLRGLGFNRTLVLLDSRRHVPTNTNGTWDTNQLPAALVERIEVVTGGASAAYGSDAVAGVVNFILNDRLDGVKANAQYGVSEVGDADQYLVNVAAGTKFAQDRAHIIVGFDYVHGEHAGTQYSRDWGASETGLAALPATRAAGLPAFLKADHVHYAIPFGSLVVACQRPGPTGALVAVSPCPVAGLTFDNNGTVRPFQFGNPRGTVQMVGGEGVIQPRNQFLSTGIDRWAGLGRLTYDFSDNLSAWAEFSAGQFKTNSRTVDYVNAGSIIIQRNNPFIPAALAAQLDAAGITQFNLARVNYEKERGLHAKNKNEFWEGAFGFRGVVMDDWNWDAYYAKGRSHFFYRPHGLTALPEYFAALYAVPGAGGQPVCGPVATNPMFAALAPAQRAAFTSLLTPGCVPLNPFGPSNESQAALDYVAPDVVSDTQYDQQAAAINLTGSPFKTWAGDVSLAVGAEWRKDKAATTLDALNAARSKASAFFAANPQPGGGSQSVKEGYIEVGLPLAADMAFAKSLDLNGAIRVTDYSASGTVTTWKAGGTWDVNDDVRLRITRSRDIRAPNVQELFYRGNDGFAVVANPITGRSNQINTAALNNPDLDPEKADTWTIGVVLHPTWEGFQGFQASIDYYSIKLKGVVGVIPFQSIINGFYLQGRSDFGQYFTFDPSQPAGFSRVDSPLLNLNSLDTEGLDVNVTYRVPDDLMPGPGQLTVNFAGSYLMKNKTYGPDGSVITNTGYLIPSYRWTTNINYRLGPFATTLTARYHSSYHSSFTLVGPDEPRYNPALPNSTNDNLWPGEVSYSLQAEYAVRDNGQRQIVVYGIIDNLFDKDPPAGAFNILEGLGSGANNVGFVDAIGRYFKVGVRMTY